VSAIPYALLMALIMVESGGNDRATGREGEMGPLQIRPILLRDVERITGRTFTDEDAFNRQTACGIALVYLNHYATEKRLGREPTLRDYALIWRHGPQGWKRPDPSPYWEKVKRHLPP
jgi:soluble lytic murein transglycosylase-like protein